MNRNRNNSRPLRTSGWQDPRIHYAGFFGLERAMLRVIDTETCGLQGGIVEIASVDIVDGQITNPMSHLVRPDRPISPQAMAIHRITEEMVADKPWIEEIVPLIWAARGMSPITPALTAGCCRKCRASGSAR
jgi:DNA polymerase III epsilon subunit-like protein